MKTLCITQARFGSSRLPGKVLLPIAGTTLLDLHLQRARKAKCIDALWVATTEEAESKAIAEIAARNGCGIYHGSLHDVLDRFYQTAKPLQPEYVVRITSDCPLIDPELIDRVVAMLENSGADYVSNTLEPSWPDGFDVEAFRFSALERAWNEADTSSDREHVTPYIWRNSTQKGGTQFRSEHLLNEADLSGLRLTVDHKSDYDLICLLVQECGTEGDWKTYTECLLGHPEWQEINHSHLRNETYKS